MKLRLGIIFGGRSGEHEISIRSAKTVLERADPAKYELVPIAIDPFGKWLSPSDSLALLPHSTRATFEEAHGLPEKREIALTGDASVRGLAVAGSIDRSLPLDVIFPVLHGTYGEDGTVQGLLDMADIPYVGCGVLASSCGMDKVFMKTLFRDAGLPMCGYVWFLRKEWERDRDATVSRVAAKLGFP